MEEPSDTRHLMMKYFFGVIFVATFIVEGFGLSCLNCRGIIQPRHCKYVSQCEPREYCAAEQVQNDHGELVYHLGCRPMTECHNSTNGELCNECCNTDLCNAHACGEPGYPLQRGPICYNCHDYPGERFCHDIHFCEVGQVCSLVSEVEFGDVITTRTCSSRLFCNKQVMGPVIGRRSLPVNTGSRSNHGDTCDICCDGDLCNVNCSAHSGQVYDPCSSNPCSYGGTCTHIYSGYTCTCPPGRTGSHCQSDVNECLSDPCIHGSCMNGVNGFNCSCYSGYTGPLCDKVSDPCSTSPCNNGTCSHNGNAYTCLCPPGTTGLQCETVLYRDCFEILNQGESVGSGVYTVYLQNISGSNVVHYLEVYCDMVTDGGGWTVFQKRFNGSVDFYRNFSEYEFGFGNVSGEFWLGLRYIREMTMDRPDLRIDLVDHNLNHAYDEFQHFYLAAPPRYNLYISSSPKHGHLSGSRTLIYNEGYAFATYDRDHNTCAVRDHGGWWYYTCTYANLNGEYITPGTVHSSRGEAGVVYRAFKGDYSLKETKMMFRRR